ncbi:NHS-like protein 1 isoform X9 [Misgurnus anguillicaudatus]|uniref:NHS-like protein 1 isoform X9 n=1 Tax=Misgurnus anguillicaudatus TaxID=75329 RepID=UPI003CCF9410
MPFPQRTVEPQLVSRLRGSEGSEKSFITSDGRRVRKPVLFNSSDEVCCQTLTGILHQLSDLSRHASDIFLGIESQAGLITQRATRIQVRLERLQIVARNLDPKKVKIPVSNLDEEKKWTVHYTAPWHQQENIFLPGTRPACVEDLHRQAKVNLKTALRECDKLRKDGFRSSQYYSQGPTFSRRTESQNEDEDNEADDADRKSTASSGEEEKGEMSSAQVEGVDGQTPCTKAAHLPTPEEKMRQQAQAVPTDIVPINVTGETFDRQASIRRSLKNTDTLTQRSKKVKRRKTISGVPDSVQLELAKGRGGELRPQSMFIPGQYSTLGRIGNGNSTLRRSETKDSGCQTEAVKIVPPSMRRIRAQRGQGIAAQMSGISTSASNISSMSDGNSSGSSIVLKAPQFCNDRQRFHSLPRGARVSLNASPLYSSTPCGHEDSTANASHQIGKLQVDDTVVHMRNAPRGRTPVRPKSQEVRGSQREWDSISGPACVVSPHAAYSTSLIPNATLSCSSEVIALHTTSSPGQSPTTGSPYSKGRPLSMVAAVNRESTSSVATGSHTPEAGIQDTCSDTCSQSDSSLHSHSTIAAGALSSEEQWIYDTPENVLPRRTLSSSCSTPINNLYSSLERSSKGTDSSSLYSMDNDGYYTSMHLDSGLRSRSQGSGHGHGIGGRAARHSMYECLGQQDDRSSLYSDRSLSRSISLRKPKKPPLPPARTDSLRRKPKKTNPPTTSTGGSDITNRSVLNESLIATLQQSLQNGFKGKGSSTSPSHSPCSDYEDPWMIRPRSQSSISVGSSNVSAAGLANVYSICHVTPSHSETSSLRSDYADSWSYYMDYPRPPSEQTQSPCKSAGQAGEMANGRGLHNGTQTSHPSTREGSEVYIKPKTGTSSPDRVHRLTSPSSGYSSQSNTPTAGTPVPSFMRCKSPSGNKPRPKVPERKSSLLSSVSISSSSTSLSSNTSDSIRHNVPPPPPPLPGVIPVCNASQTFPPPPPVLPMTPSQEASMPPPYINSSPEFPPPPPPEVWNDPGLSNLNSSFSPPPPPPPPSCAISPAYPSPQIPLLPSMTPSPASLKDIKSSLKPVNTERISESTHSEESSKLGVPLITPLALQSVQLRSVKRPEKIELTADQLANKTPEKLQKPDHPTVSPVSPQKNGFTLHRQDNVEVVEAQPDRNVRSIKKSYSAPAWSLTNGSIDFGDVKATDEVDGLETPLSSPVKTPQNTTPRKMPPVVSKKPKFPLTFRPLQNHTASTDEDAGELLNAQNEEDISTTECQEPTPMPQQEEEKPDNNNRSEISLPPEEMRKMSLTNVEFSKTPCTIIQETDCDVDKSISTEEREEDGDEEDVTSNSGSVGSKDDESGDVFEPSTVNTAESPSISGDKCGDMVTPTRPRTTEDLFAAIHRSKRKVLGRKESEEERTQGPLSPPVTPTGTAPTLTSPLHRQTGSIQRNLRKSSTSSDTFKALLLKKGSHSGTSFRMSAAEMLRTTDPRFHRTRSLDSSFDPSSPTTPSPDSPCASPGRNKRSLDDWSPRCSPGSPFSTSPSLIGPKYGRSRTPPSAASSKYNARSRILSSPMTVICERDGELTESGEYGEEPCSISPVQDSNSTLCEQSSS